MAERPSGTASLSCSAGASRLNLKRRRWSRGGSQTDAERRFIPFPTADSSTHFRLNQFPSLRRPETIISCRRAFPRLQKQDKSGQIVASNSDQSTKVGPPVRPISDDHTSGANHLFGNDCLIRRCVEGHCVNCCGKVGSDARGRISACAGTQKSWHSPHGCWGETTLARWRLGKAEHFLFFSVFFLLLLLTTMLIVIIEVGRQAFLFICSPYMAHRNKHQFKPIRVSLQ